MWWKGWAVFGSILMMITGAFQLLAGIFALFNSEVIVQGYDGYYLFDLSGSQCGGSCWGPSSCSEGSSLSGEPPGEGS